MLPADHVRSAIAAVYRHNFRADLTAHHSVQRTYALGDEAGLVLCSWPRGGRPRIPFVYSDEVWTGIEYQVAAHLIYEGLVDEGLRARAGGARPPRRHAPQPLERGRVRQPLRPLARQLGPCSSRSAARDYDAPTAHASTFAPRLGGDLRALLHHRHRLGSSCAIDAAGAELAARAAARSTLDRLVRATTPDHGRLDAGPVARRRRRIRVLTASDHTQRQGAPR